LLVHFVVLNTGPHLLFALAGRLYTSLHTALLIITLKLTYQAPARCIAILITINYSFLSKDGDLAVFALGLLLLAQSVIPVTQHDCFFILTPSPFPSCMIPPHLFPACHH
jgi:hypothetical protein